MNAWLRLQKYKKNKIKKKRYFVFLRYICGITDTVFSVLPKIWSIKLSFASQLAGGSTKANYTKCVNEWQYFGFFFVSFRICVYELYINCKGLAFCTIFVYILFLVGVVWMLHVAQNSKLPHSTFSLWYGCADCRISNKLFDEYATNGYI